MSMSMIQSVLQGQSLWIPKAEDIPQGLCKYNITTGELTEISDPERMAGLKSLFGISLADSIIAEGATNNDILNIYNFKGELLHKTEGPDYLI